jgi:hypothetical protein
LIPWFQRLFERQKRREGRGEEPLVTSVANPTSTLAWVQNLNLACDWPFVKICQTSLGNKHHCKLIVAIMAIIIAYSNVYFPNRFDIFFIQMANITCKIQILNLIKCGSGICNRCDQRIVSFVSQRASGTRVQTAWMQNFIIIIRRKKNTCGSSSRPTLFFFCRPYYFFNVIDRATLFSLGGCGLLPKWRLLSH